VTQGPTTHLAARMEQLATPGTVRLSAATLRLVEGLVQVKALGAIPIKGMTESMARAISILIWRGFSRWDIPLAMRGVSVAVVALSIC
jgi:hypothetical protein